MSLLLLVVAIWLGATVGLTAAWALICWYFREQARRYQESV